MTATQRHRALALAQAALLLFVTLAIHGLHTHGVRKPWPREPRPPCCCDNVHEEAGRRHSESATLDGPPAAYSACPACDFLASFAAPAAASLAVLCDLLPASQPEPPPPAAPWFSAAVSGLGPRAPPF